MLLAVGESRDSTLNAGGLSGLDTRLYGAPQTCALAAAVHNQQQQPGVEHTLRRRGDEAMWKLNAPMHIVVFLGEEAPCLGFPIKSGMRWVGTVSREMMIAGFQDDFTYPVD